MEAENQQDKHIPQNPEHNDNYDVRCLFGVQPFPILIGTVAAIGVVFVTIYSCGEVDWEAEEKYVEKEKYYMKMIQYVFP